MYKFILDNKTHFLDSPINFFENIKIRFINRRTSVYFKLLKLLNQNIFPWFLTQALINGNWSSLLSSERKQMLSGEPVNILIVLLHQMKK